MTKIIGANGLSSWLKGLAEEYTLIAPVTTQGVTEYAPVGASDIDRVDLEFLNTVISPKGYFFPPSEIMFNIAADDGHAITPVGMDKDVIIFGIRPCDAKGIALIDKVFLAEPADTGYAEKRQKTSLIGLACSKPGPGCFCTSAGGGPANPMYVDILLTPISSGYIVQTITGKGKDLSMAADTQENEIPLPDPPQVDSVPFEGISQRMRDVFNSGYWDKVADRCIHCNICAYVCPCCYCFDIRDYTAGNSIERVRTWESCQSPAFTRIAGGHDPRLTKGARLRQRWYHKLLYFPAIYGDIKCTGCGRCVRSCPVNIDIREIIANVQEMKV
jgi:ferredoxin